MASIERTAYPRFPRTLTLKDLQASFTPRSDEVAWADHSTRRPARKLALLVLMKCFQHLRYFPSVDAIPAQVVAHVAATLGMPPEQTIRYPKAHTALYRDHKMIRQRLGVEAYTDAQTRKLAIRLALEAAAVVETRADIINAVIEELVRRGHELPVFRTLDDIAERAHADAEATLYAQIANRLTQDQRAWLDDLLVAELPIRRTLYNQIKRSAKKASRSHLDLLLDQMQWLEDLPDSESSLEDVPVTKLKHMAEMASVLDAGDMKDMRPEKRHALIVALIRQMRIRARDDIAEMFIRRMSIVHKSARDELQLIQTHQRESSEGLVATLEDVLGIVSENLDDATTGHRVRELFVPAQDLDRLRAECEAIRTWSRGNHLPLLWKPFSSWRSAMFRMAKSLQFDAATQDRSLLDALQVVLDNEHRKSEWIADEVVLSFASERWHKLVRRSHALGHPTNRRFLEICVFSHRTVLAS